METQPASNPYMPSAPPGTNPAASSTRVDTTVTTQPTPTSNVHGTSPGGTKPKVAYPGSAEDEILRRRKVRWGMLYVFLLDILLMPTSIILTFWVPGIAFATFLTVPILATTYYLVLKRNLLLSKKAKTWAGIGLFVSLLSMLAFITLAVYSILVFHRRRGYYTVVYSIAGSVAAYSLHFLFAFITLAVLFQHLSKPLTETKEVRTETRRNV